MSNFKFRHFLNFIDLPNVGKIQISEPFGFDGSTHSVKQEDGRNGRDVVIADEEITFEFTREEFEKLNEPQQLINGVTINHASHGYDYIMDCLNNEGWESGIEWIIERNGTEFVKGYFDGFTAITGNDSIKFKVIQDTKRELVKRRDDVFVNAFSNKDLDDNDIEPCQTQNVLLKALPLYQKSQWKENGQDCYGGIVGIYNGFGPSNSIIRRGANPSNVVVKDGLQNTLSFFENSSALGVDGQPTAEAFSFFYALEETKNLQIELSNIEAYSRVIRTTAFGGSVASASALLQFVVQVGIDIDTIDYQHVLYSKSYGNVGTTPATPFPTSFSLNIPYIGKGKRLYIFVKATGTFVGAGASISARATYDAGVVFSKMTVDISATSKAVDTVLKGVRLTDLIKHNAKAISGLPVSDSIYDIGCPHYNNFAFNGYLLGQVTDKPFQNKFKDLMTILKEVNADYQINPENIELLPYADYYTNNEIFASDELPDHESTSYFNKKHYLKTLEFNYKKSSNSRETNGENTNDDVHGKTQWLLPKRPNRNVTADGNLKIELDHIRSAFLIEEQRKRINDTKNNKSLQYDDSLFLIEVAPLPPSYKCGFGSVLLMRILDNGHLQILNQNQNGDGGSFDWTLLGFGVGSQFFIDSGENVGTWQVVSITSTVLELSSTTVTATFEGDAFIEVSYFLTDVVYVNRTSEGFTVIEGVEAKENYSNLSYSVKRNLINWYPYLATATKYVQDLFIKNTSFEPNGNLITKLSVESQNVVDNESISTTEISTLKILNPLVHKATVFADFDEILQLMTDVRDVKGFCRVKLNSGKIIKGFVKELEYEWATGKLELIMEEKYESDFMTITKKDGVIYVNEVGYSQKSGVSNYVLNGDYLILYDAKDIALNNPIRFTNVTINGVKYTNINDFSSAVQNIL